MIPANTPPANFAADLAAFLPEASTRGKKRARRARRVGMRVWSMIAGATVTVTARKGKVLG